MIDRHAELEALLRGIEERVEHRENCAHRIALSGDAAYALGRELSTKPGGGEWGPMVPLYNACSCDRPARVRAEQARTVERMVQEALLTGIAHTAALELKYPQGVPQGWDTPIIDAAWAAALRAGETHE